MKRFIERGSFLFDLDRSITECLAARANATVTVKSATPIQVTEEVEYAAAKKIQHLWRGYKVKEAFMKDPYGTYLSMVDQDDEQRLLSSLMFGRHQAEIRAKAKDRIPNPYIHTWATYHRCDYLSDAVKEQLLKAFNISPEKSKDKFVMAVTRLKDDGLNEFITGAGKSVDMISAPNSSITVVLLPMTSKEEKDQNILVRNRMVSAGFVASPWEVAQNIAKLQPKDALIETTPNVDKPIHMAGLPETKEALLESDLFYLLTRIAHNSGYPTHKLAASLIKLLNNDDVLSPAAIKRIALIIDMANTFYSNNYPRFAFCVYAIIHELSLSIAKQTDPAQLDLSFDRFMSESNASLKNSLGLVDDDLTKTTFVASPALSGTNAFIIAKKIASYMDTSNGMAPTIEVHEPCYYELDTAGFNKAEQSSAPDIFLFSTGPIVNIGGLTPGVDINLFVQKNIIDTGRTKPTTLIIDTTTTLYKNLHLDENVKQLVKNGNLSIIIFESHQKFGLLHTDQAQYGRVMGLCSTSGYHSNALAQTQLSARVNFNNHIDMRIGANINHCCGDTLEQVKQQHFTNGALFKTILRRATLISEHLVKHKYMLTNLKELYFVVPIYSYASVVPARNSFGHYATTLSAVMHLQRLCANASDDIDSLILSARIYLALGYNTHKIDFELIEQSKQNVYLSRSEQIIALAMAQNMIDPKVCRPPRNLVEKIECYYALKNILHRCRSLKGRDVFEETSRYFYHLQQEIIDEAKSSKENPQFLNAIRIAYNSNIPVSMKLINAFQSAPRLCSLVTLENTLSLSSDAIRALSILDRSGHWSDEEIMLARNNPLYCELILQVYNGNANILDRLKCQKDRKKYDDCLAYLPIYSSQCFGAIRQFCLNNPLLDHHKKELIESLSGFNTVYADTVLYKDRNCASRVAKAVIMGLKAILVSIIACIPTMPLSLSHLYNQRLFKTTSEKELMNTEDRLKEIILPTGTPLNR